MSEYQYYEFQALDRRLTENQMRELRVYSSRARITPTTFANDYSFSRFRGDPDMWMEQYFDASIYMTDVGMHIFQFRLPTRVLSADRARVYCRCDLASVREASGHLIFEFVSEEPRPGLLEPDGVLASLLPVREDVARGDLRVLYLGWLLAAQESQLADDDIEPPVPPGLGNPTHGLAAFVKFLKIDPTLLEAAAEESRPSKGARISQDEMRVWLASLPPTDKDDLLVKLMVGDDPHLGAELCCRLERQSEGYDSTAEVSRRTVGELLAAAEIRADLAPLKRRGAAGRIIELKQP